MRYSCKTMLSDNIWAISLSRQNPLQMILVLVLCKTLTPPLATDHLSSNCIDPFLKMFLYPLLACCQMEQAPWNCRRFNSNQHFHKFPLATTSPKLGARQKLWKCFWRLNANVRFQIELKHFALPIATKNVYNQTYFPSMPNRIIGVWAAQPKIVAMVTIVKI